MNAKKFIVQLAATFVSAALGNLGTAQLLGVEEWKAAVMSGGYVVLEVIRKLAIAMRDGSLTDEEAADLFVASETEEEAK
jgi:hypothetical protein